MANEMCSSSCATGWARGHVIGLLAVPGSDRSGPGRYRCPRGNSARAGRARARAARAARTRGAGRVERRGAAPARRRRSACCSMCTQSSRSAAPSSTIRAPHRDSQRCRERERDPPSVVPAAATSESRDPRQREKRDRREREQRRLCRRSCRRRGRRAGAMVPCRLALSCSRSSTCSSASTQRASNAPCPLRAGEAQSPHVSRPGGRRAVRSERRGHAGRQDARVSSCRQRSDRMGRPAPSGAHGGRGPVGEPPRAAEFVEKFRALLGVTLDHVVLVLIERPRLVQDRVRNRELADVVDQPADRERAQTTRRQAEQLADENARRATRRCSV